MTEFKDKIVCPLRKPVTYHSKGDGATEAHEITIEAPSNKVLSQMSRLEQGYARAENEQSDSMADKMFASGLMADKKFMDTMQQAEDKSQNKFKDMDDAEIASKAIDLIKASTVVNFDEYMMIFKDIVTKTGTLDDDTRVTTPIYEAIDYRDTQIMLGSYLVNFTNISST